MRKVLIYSLLLIAGLVLAQIVSIPRSPGAPLQLLTMIALAFIMIHVGYEFELDKSRPLMYAWDATVAFISAALPWLFCALYFIFVMSPAGLRSHPDLWREAFLEGLFAAPTSAGVLFSMLAAAGLGASWVFKEARVLAIFDDLGTILFIIPLKSLMVGMKWQLMVIVLLIIGLLWLAWRYLHRLRWPMSWPWVLGYGTGITLICEGIYLASKKYDPAAPVQLEALLPAFALGCMLARPAGSHVHSDDAREEVEVGPENAREQKAATLVSACFMVLVGMSMPPITAHPAAHGPISAAVDYAGAAPSLIIEKNAFPGWGVIARHVLAITVISNIGKMFPALCYRREVRVRERLALAIGMFPRGEVGAGVLLVALTYGLRGPTLTVAVLSLALNLVCTGLFIIGVKKLLAR